MIFHLAMQSLTLTFYQDFQFIYNNFDKHPPKKKTLLAKNASYILATKYLHILYTSYFDLMLLNFFFFKI